MKKILLTFSIFFNFSILTFGQLNISITPNKTKNIELIRLNVQTFFINQNNRFRNQLKGLNQEYALYFTPKYSFRGMLDFYIQDAQNLNQLNYYKPTQFEKPLNAPQQIIDYSKLLLKRTFNNWCEDRFGYKDLKFGDEFGILLIFSPKKIPDSLSVLKVKYYVPSDYETATENKKRMMDLFTKILDYHFIGEGLNERFIRVELKY